MPFDNRASKEILISSFGTHVYSIDAPRDDTESPYGLFV
jgi:hypothetical protein